MKKYVSAILSCTAIVAFCSFLIFLMDLAVFGRGGKACGIWDGLFVAHMGTTRELVLMANMDICCILLSLFLCGLSILILFRRHGYRVLFIPIAGGILFFAVGRYFLCFI